MTTITTVELLAKDINREGGVHCPSPLSKMEVWDTHPRVFLNIANAEDHRARCPYCGTEFQLKAGEHIGGHH